MTTPRTTSAHLPDAQPRPPAGPTADPGVRLLQAVVLSPVPLTLDELVTACGASRAEAAVTVGTLVDGGLVERRGDGRFEPGWLLHGLRPDGQGSVEHAELALDEGFAAFCSERLTEEVVAATLRRGWADDPTDDPTGDLTGDPSSDPAGRADAGLRLLDELLAGLRRGALPDDVTLQLLCTAYGDHPDFDERWRRPRSVLGSWRGTWSPDGAGRGC